MSIKIGRRDFIAATMAAVCIPKDLFAAEQADVVLRFAAVSDVHYDKSHNDRSAQRIRFAKTMQFMNQYSDDSVYRNFDALVVAGDFSNRGIPEEIGPFKKTMDENLRDSTKRVLCMGNHEFYGGNRKLWEKTFQTEANRHQIINGFHFITVAPEKGTCDENDYLYAVDWLDKEIAAACKADPKKPVFVVQHYHVYATVSGSYDLPGDFHAGVRDFLDILKKYPQVVHISGHSHVPSVDPRSIWQGEFTAIGTGSLSYFGLYESTKNFQRGNNVDPGQAGTFLLFEVMRDNAIRIRLYDTITDSFFDREYLIADPADFNKYIYTNKRLETASEPSWPSGAKALLTETSSRNATLEFPQGTDRECVTYYRFEIERLQDGRWIPFYTDFAWADFFMKKRTSKMSVDISGLLAESQYKVRVFTVNAFQKSSPDPLTVEFTTKPDDKSIDRKSLNPNANFIDLTVDKDGAVNRPLNPLFNSKVIKLGQPKFITDESLGAVALLDGKKDCFLVPVPAKQYEAIRPEVTLALSFRIDLEKAKGEIYSLFGNTESGGLSFEYRPKKKELSFICYFNGQYEKVSAPFDGKGHAILHGTFDGARMTLYLNGKEVARKKQTGRIAYTKSAKARAFCAGGDVTPQGGSRFNFPGLIAWARVFSWALTPEQIAAATVSKK